MSELSVPTPAPSHAQEEGPAQAQAGRGRPTWSGLLQVGLLAVPVKAYSANATAPELPRHLFHAGCGRRLRYEKRCPVHGTVDGGAIVKGYEYAPGRFLILDEAELEQFRPARDRAFALDCFLDLAAPDPILFAGRTLYLLPDGPAAQQAYAVLRQALHERHKGALGRLVLSGRRHVALLRPLGRLLVVHLLHFPAQLRAPAALEAELRSASLGEAELSLAAALIDAYSRPLRWSDYRDDSAEQLAALVDAKVRSPETTPAVPEQTPALALLDALRQSVAALQPPPDKGQRKVRRRSP